MKKDLFGRYVWIVDTIRQYGKISRRRLNELWLKSSMGDGNPIPERTFFHYRRAIEENFHIDICCTPQGEYYIESGETPQDKAFRNWLLDSYAVRGVMSDSASISNRILVEEVPSARQFLSSVMESIRASKKVKFTYAGYTRSLAEEGIVYRPYFVKLFKQRWYVIGYKEKDREIRTYALDRIREFTILEDSFEMPDTIDPIHFFDDYFGITTSKGDVCRVSLQVDRIQAKYFRALPLHHTQTEIVNEKYSIFSYKMKLTDDFVREILSYGATIKVLQPAELRIRIIDELKKNLKEYEN